MSNEFDEVKELKELYDFANEEETLERDEEILKKSEEIKGAYEELLKAYQEEQDDIIGLLEEDDDLLEQLVDRLSMINLYELTGETDLEGIEGMYLSLIDICIEAAKIHDPMAGFGRDRLEAALGILAGFEKENWPLITGITPENIGAFEDIIPWEHYDDILEGRKRAMGAVRLIDDKTTVAGVIVYSINTVIRTDIKLEWIYVPEDFRSAGIGNMLMAKLLEFTWQIEDAAIYLTMNVPNLNDEYDKRNFAFLEQFLDSWKFDFHMDTGLNFYISVEDQIENPKIKGSVNGVRSLSSLGVHGQALFRNFFIKLGNDFDEMHLDTSYGFYEPDVSCAFFEDGEIKSILLLHRFEDGDYRYEALRALPGYDDHSYILKMLRFAYQMLLKKKDFDSVIFGNCISEEGFEVVRDIFPEARTMMQYIGVLSTPQPNNTITTQEWEMLRSEAGLSGVKIPLGEIDEDAFSEEKMEKLLKIFG